jgi:D-lactate dehydrogenase
MQNIGAKVKAYDLYPDVAWAASRGISYADSIKDVVKDADIVSLHCPSMPSTYHMMNRQILLEETTRPIILINTSRGDLLDTDALLEALQCGKVLAAGLDVLEGEVEILRGQQIKLSVEALLQHPNVIFTPHMAYFTKEALHEIWSTSIMNLSKFAKGELLDASYIRA